MPRFTIVKSLERTRKTANGEDDPSGRRFEGLQPLRFDERHPSVSWAGIFLPKGFQKQKLGLPWSLLVVMVVM